MEYQEVLIKVEELFREVFKDSTISIREGTSAGDINQWNSLNHVLLIDRIEKEFNIKFSLPDMLEMNTVRDICDKIISLSPGV